jgi:hypothetical protein
MKKYAIFLALTGNYGVTNGYTKGASSDNINELMISTGYQVGDKTRVLGELNNNGEYYVPSINKTLVDNGQYLSTLK